ncbi:MAG: alpha/beta fold hydrolase, partial [Gammaproteobacteria bacterium]
MNIIKRLKRAAWSTFERSVDAFMERGFGVYSYPPASPEPVRSDPHGVLARTEAERPTVIALHTGAGSPEQWWPLAERLRLRYRVLAPDLHSDAASRASGAHPPLSLDAEAARIEPLLDTFPGPVYLVGQDYGAAVALKLAHRRRERIGGLVLYEPTPFGLLLADPGSRSAALDIAVLRRVLGRYVEAGDWFRAALRYVEHCSGADAWRGLSTQERAAIAWRMPEVCAQLDAQFADPTPLAGYARIDVPVRLLTGARTCAATTERIAELLAGTLPRAEWRRVDGADWMGPVARAEAVDREIEGFLAQQQA